MSENWKSKLRLRLEDFVDGFVVEGAKQEEVFAAIIDEIGNLRAGYNRDPDPSDNGETVIEEPANDWPAADHSS